MTKPTLLVLAAGMGSRYGGLKQIDPVGPNGETILDYSIYDALRSGFGRVVFVIRRDIEAPFKEIVGTRFEKRIAVDYVFQEIDKLPSGISVPAGRVRPWGTAHAILMADGVVQEPFSAINADDFYGEESFRVLAEYLRSGTTDYGMVGFVLRKTLSEFGSVSRGVCEISPDGFLAKIVERTKIEWNGTGATFPGDDGKVSNLTGDELVSMNLWAFTPDLFPQLRAQFVEFLKAHGGEKDSEFYISSSINNLIETGEARVKVLRTNAGWFGVTHREDRPFVAAGIRKLVEQGNYPAKLWT